MDLKTIEQIAYDSMAERKEHKSREPGWLFFHGARTARIASWLCARLEYEDQCDVIYVAALFHDIGKGNKPHNEIGAAMTWQLLEPYCSTEELEAVCEIIKRHNMRNHASDSQPVKIVQDADILDHVGAIGVWTSFYWSGVHNETVEDHVRFVCGEENDRYRKNMRASLNFDVSKQIFDERIAFEKDFFGRFHKVYKEGY